MLRRFATCSAMLLPLLASSLARADGLIDICDRDACLVTHSDKDTDGDGVSDADEIAAGSDPNDPESRPRLHELLDLIRLEALPSFTEHHSFVVVLPMLTPAGKPVFGGLIALPGRTNTLAALGIDPSKVDPFLLANGLAVGPSAPQAPSPAPGTPPLRMGGIGMALIADGDTSGGGVKAPPTPAIIGTINAAHGRSNPDELVFENSNQVGDYSFGAMRFEVPDDWEGKHDVTEVNWRVDPNGYEVQVKAYRDGQLVGTASRSVHDTKDEEGRDVHEVVESQEDKVKGTKSTTTRTTGSGPSGPIKIVTEKTDATGKTTVTAVKKACEYCPSQPTDPDTSVNDEEAIDEEEQVERDDDYTSADDASYDPTANNRKLGIIPTDTISAILAVRGGNITYGDTGVEADGEEPVTSTPDGEVIIHVEEDPAGAGGIGGVGFGTGLPKFVPQPRFDPRLPMLPIGGGAPVPPDCIAAKTC